MNPIITGLILATSVVGAGRTGEAQRTGETVQQTAQVPQQSNQDKQETVKHKHKKTITPKHQKHSSGANGTRPCGQPRGKNH